MTEVDGPEGARCWSGKVRRGFLIATTTTPRGTTPTQRAIRKTTTTAFVSAAACSRSLCVFFRTSASAVAQTRRRSPAPTQTGSTPMRKERTCTESTRKKTTNACVPTQLATSPWTTGTANHRSARSTSGKRSTGTKEKGWCTTTTPYAEQALAARSSPLFEA